MRASQPVVAGLESGARTSLAWIDPAAAFRTPTVPGPELASVHGGTVTGSGQIALAPQHSHKWTLGVLGIAALFGVSAAIAMNVGGGMSDRSAEAAPPPKVPVSPPVSAAPVPAVPVPVVVPVPPTAAPAEQVAAPVEKQEQVAPLAPVEAPKPPVAHKTKVVPVKKAGPDATLRIVTDEATWAKVTIGSEVQDAPGAKFHLAAGTYTVRLRNSDLDISMACQVSLEPGKVKTLWVALEDKQCYGD